MTNEELAVKIKDGETGLIEELWLQNIGLINQKARHYIPTDRSTDKFELGDLMQDAVEAFDPLREFKFTSYLGYHLRNAFHRELGITKNHKSTLRRATSYDAPQQGAEEGNLTIKDTLPDEAAGRVYDELLDAITEEQDFNIVMAGMKKLEPRQRDVIIQHYINGSVLETIAAEYGLTRARIQQIEALGLLKLRRMKVIRELARERAIERRIDEKSIFYKAKSAAAFQSSGTSAIEDLVEKREYWRRKWSDEDVEKFMASIDASIAARNEITSQS
jgi:RNA polymerase sigma factor (sigma-70 family)